jgi:hypothetical protein
MQLFPESALTQWRMNRTTMAAEGVDLSELKVFEDPDLQLLWPKSVERDNTKLFTTQYAAVQEKSTPNSKSAFKSPNAILMQVVF